MEQAKNTNRIATTPLPHIYDFEMGPATGATAPFTDPAVTAIIQSAEAKYNAYYLSPAYIGENPKHITVTIQPDILKIKLYSTIELEKGREGQALRQFSCYLIDLGILNYLNESDPQKILRRV